MVPAPLSPDLTDKPVLKSPSDAVRLTGVDKRFANSVVALQGVDFAVRPGEFVSLLGPSGCGKSTVLRLIAGLASPNAGTVAVAPGSRREGQNRIGFVFQEPTLMPWRTVLGNVMLPLRLAGTAKAAALRSAQEAIGRVGLQDFAGSYPRQLSGGMKMRVSIARALVTRPDLLLMDEPFAALDEITRFKLNEDVLAVWAERRLTCLFITHSVFESVFLSTRVLVMAPRPGRVVADIPIDAPWPRDAAYRTSAHYNEQARIVSAALAEAMDQASAAPERIAG